MPRFRRHHLPGRDDLHRELRAGRRARLGLEGYLRRRIGRQGPHHELRHPGPVLTQRGRRTYMVGELFNLPLVSECVDWARYLIRRHFAPGASASSAGPTAVQRSPSLAAV